MYRYQWLEVATRYLLCMLAFVLPFSFILTAYTIIALAACWLLNGHYKKTFTNLFHRKALWPWIIFFLLHVISYTYSENKAQSAFDIESKLSLLILPVIIGAGLEIDRKTQERIFLFFTYSISLLAIYCTVHACIRCINADTLYIPFFFYNELVEGLDPSAVYMALYTLLSLTALLFFPWKEHYYGKYNLIKIFFVVIQMIFFIQLSSRMLILIFLVLLIPFYLRKVFISAKIATPKILAFIALFAIVITTVFLTDNPVRKRFSDIFEKNLDIAWQKDYRNIPQEDFNNVSLRIMLWRFGIENIQEQHIWLLGAGNGDELDLQNKKLKQYGFDISNPDLKKRSEFYNINLHNMWLQSLMMLGIIGMVVFSIMVFSPLFYFNKIEYRHLYFIFNISMLFFMFQEASLQTQAGIAYYTFFTMLFWNFYYRKVSISK